MFSTSRRLGQLIKRTTATAAGNNVHADPATMAVARVVTELMQSNAQERQRVDDKLDAHRKDINEKVDSSLDRVNSSIQEFRSDMKSSIQGLRSDMNKMKEEVHGLDKKVTFISGAAGFLFAVAGLFVRSSFIS